MSKNLPGLVLDRLLNAKQSVALQGETCCNTAQGKGEWLRLGHRPQAKTLVSDELTL